VDGDEKRSGGIAVCDGGTGDEAVTSGDVAPAPVDGELAEHESAADTTAVDASVATEDSGPGDAPVSDEAAADETVSDEAAADETVSDETVSDEPETSEPAAAGDSDDAEPDEQAPAEAGTVEALPPTGRPRLRPYLRRGAVALVAAGFVAVGVGAFAWTTPSPEGANQRFVEAAQSQGHVVAPGEQETLVISAARKICDRRITHDTDQERRATALNSDEIAAVGTAFGADTRDFTTLALETFCSS